jgi:SAM-dependent methyltransferase
MPLDVKSTWNACGEAFDRFTSADDSYSDNIERPAVEQLIGDVTGARVLELGCGSGPYSCRFAQAGAQVTALDLSRAMISLAKARAVERGVRVDFRVADIREPLPFSEAQFDLVFSATTLHYVDDLAIFIREVARVMNPRARFVASVLHPLSTASFPLADADGAEADQWADRYFGAPLRCIETPWLGFGDVPDEGRRINCYHHTIAEYFDALAAAGLAVTRLLEPEPPPEFAAKNPARYEEANRRPLYLIFSAGKTA